MIKERNQFYQNLLLILDLMALSLAWLASYYLRFYGGIVPLFVGIAPFKPYLNLLGFILVIWIFIFKYIFPPKTRWTGSTLGELPYLVRATTLMFLLLVVITFFVRQEISRVVLLHFLVLSTIALDLSRGFFRQFLRYLSQKGYSTINTLIIGGGPMAREVHLRVLEHGELGLTIVGCLTDEPGQIDYTHQSAPGGLAGEVLRPLGTYKDVRKIIHDRDVNLIIIVLPLEEQGKLEPVLGEIADEMVDIKIVPDFHKFITLGGEIEELDGLNFITLQGSPLHGWNVVVKRALDAAISFCALILFLPLMIIVALLIKLTSPGPIFYRQERSGLNGKVFNILKFRSMRLDAEEQTGPVWATPDDPRCTRLGRFLRRNRIDELPQLINVLKGDMSLVGPRPERPVFIQEFKKRIPRYMLRHKMKAGITGWAQIREWKENLSLDKRIEYDLYYIQNWSVMLDLQIMFLTLWNGLLCKNNREGKSGGVQIKRPSSSLSK